MAIAVQEIPIPFDNQFCRDCDSLTHNTFKKVVLHKTLEIWKQTGESIDTIKNCSNPFFFNANTSSELNFIKNKISQDEFTITFNQIAIIMEKGIDLFKKNNSFPVFDERLFDEIEKDDDLQL
ncbi:hypothetical protein GLOIN_2v1766437 [Rhizophagus clarus]|uniref:Uncharacterized protein n=1 Tax=Rhizophagus clarus TaxID=94130 RepID=A0A8H3QRW1_9GLOM|nr:hypothetical protein GLOIN_2v1766437 [Rhizophagus clarus]